MISETDIQYRLSGGAVNSNPNTSLGGAMSSVAVVSATTNNLFDNVSGSEVIVGDIEFRCFYVRNNNAGAILFSPVVWIVSNTPSPHDEIDIGLDPAGTGDGSTSGVATSVANEDSAPSGVVFSRPATKAVGLSIGGLLPGRGRAIWVRRTVGTGAAAVDGNTATIRVEGDTVAA